MNSLQEGTFRVLMGGDSFSGSLGFVFSLEGESKPIRIDRFDCFEKNVVIPLVNQEVKIFHPIDSSIDQTIGLLSVVPHAIIFVFNLLSDLQYESVKTRIKAIQNQMLDKEKLLLVGCNSRNCNERKVSFDEVQDFCLKRQIIYSEIESLDRYFTTMTVLLMLNSIKIRVTDKYLEDEHLRNVLFHSRLKRFG